MYLDIPSLLAKDSDSKFQMLTDVVNLFQYDDGVFVRYSQDR